MDRYAVLFTFYLLVISLIVYILIAVILNLNFESQWYKNLTKSVVEVNINRYVFIVMYFLVSLLPYLILFNDPVLLVYLLIGALSSFFWIVILFLGQNLKVSAWLVVPIFLYYLWLFSYLWWRNLVAAVFLIPLLVFIIFVFYHVVHLASINDAIL